MSSLDNSKKLSVGATFLSRLFVNHYGWMASKCYRFAPPIYQWFAETVASLNEHFYPLALFSGESRSITTQE